MKEIDKLKAEQARLSVELEMVGERIKRLETPFIPGWYIARTPMFSASMFLCLTEGAYETILLSHADAVPVTREILDGYLPKQET